MPRKKIPSPNLSPAGEQTQKLCLRLRSFREAAGLEQKALAARIGVTPNAVSNWENARSRPDLNLIPALCSALSIRPDQLFDLPPENSSKTGGAPALTDAEEQLLHQYRQLNSLHQKALQDLAFTLLCEERQKSPLVRLLFYERALSAGCGDPSEFDQEGKPVWVLDSPQARRSDYVFTVSGDSMEPAYHDGDLVLVSRLSDGADLPRGEVGAFISGNETYLKLRGEQGLLSLNPAYRPLLFDENQGVYLIGRVERVLSPEEIVSVGEAPKGLSPDEN